MSLIVKDDGSFSTESMCKGNSQQRELGEIRTQVAAIVKQYDDKAVWDAIQAKDVPTEILDYVFEQVENGFDYHQIRRQLGIFRSTDKSWRKIMSAIRQGFRIDQPALLQQKAFEFEAMSKKLRSQIMKAFDEGIETLDPDGNIVKIKGPSKELSQAIDAYNKLNQGFIKIGKDLGAFIDGADSKSSGGNGGVTIVVQNNVPIPTQVEVKAHQEKLTEKSKRLMEDALAIPTTGHEVPKSKT